MLYSPVQDTHIFLARSQILLVVIGVVSELGRPVALIIVQDQDGKRKSRGSYFGRRVDQHSMLDQGQLCEVLSHVEQLVIRLCDLAKALQEAIAAEHR